MQNDLFFISPCSDIKEKQSLTQEERHKKISQHNKLQQWYTVLDNIDFYRTWQPTKWYLSLWSHTWHRIRTALVNSRLMQTLLLLTWMTVTAQMKHPIMLWSKPEKRKLISIMNTNCLNITSSWRVTVYSPLPIYIMTPEEYQQTVYYGSLYFWNSCSLIYLGGLTGNVSQSHGQWLR